MGLSRLNQGAEPEADADNSRLALPNAE
jgi:hypothetical protein